MITNGISLFIFSFSGEKSNLKWSEVDILKLAAGVEANTVHPIGKAIVEAAQAIKCLNMKVPSPLDD